MVNVLAPNGLVWSRSKLGYASNAQANVRYIKKGYATSIGLGDIVKTGTSGNQGYTVIGAFNDSTGMGVFAGVYPYYDTTQQGTSHGLNASWPGSAANAAADVPCRVYLGLGDVFRIQASGTYTNSMAGNNCNWLTGTNGAPNAAGISTLTADLASVATTNTLPFRIEGVAGVPGGPSDPTMLNPTIEVSFNPAWLEMLVGTGI